VRRGSDLSDNIGALALASCSFVGMSVLTDVASFSLLPSVLPSVKLFDKKNCVMLFKSGVEIASAKSGSCDLSDSMSSGVSYEYQASIKNKILRTYIYIYIYIL